MEDSQTDIIIDVGDLGSISSVFLVTKNGLNEFNSYWKQGVVPTVKWDMRDIRTGKINVGATSFFLALAQRIRSYSNSAIPILIDWHPKTLSFLYDIGFFHISNRYDLFKWPYPIGGFDSGNINPNTLLSSYDELIPKPSFNDQDKIIDWKRYHREAYRGELIDLCESLFNKSDKNKFGFSKELPLIISRTCSELVTNSLLWGGVTAFVGLQRARNGIFINVSDIGIGMKASLLKKNVNIETISDFKNIDLVSILICSIINEKDFGLKRAISSVVETGGNITILTNSCEIHWSNENWNKFNNDIDCHNVKYAIDNFPPPITGRADIHSKDKGYYRNWNSGIRGTRISFFIPTNGFGGF
ncbi:hypothetical protein [Pectobacterium polaris]|uniref:hypothetical protein n=1 Tax=Pectobacterium polaris TaxID=2042057 RepID=UPI0021C6EAFA|nr:hypothetical protein [Pectobacterium polaris]MCU1792485.1 hypothetical protein [Pectobacterium polaris]